MSLNPIAKAYLMYQPSIKKFDQIKKTSHELRSKLSRNYDQPSMQASIFNVGKTDNEMDKEEDSSFTCSSESVILSLIDEFMFRILQK